MAMGTTRYKTKRIAYYQFASICESNHVATDWNFGLYMASLGYIISSLTSSNPPVLDTNGQALEAGVEYYILPNVNQTGGSEKGGGLTLIDRNGTCPLYVGQEDLVGLDGLPVIFIPFLAGETVIRELWDFRVAFSAATTCIQSTAWKVGESDPETGRRFTVTGASESGYDGFFRIGRNKDTYNLEGCPADACPICRLRCGSAGILTEAGKRLLALDGPALPVVFKKA